MFATRLCIDLNAFSFRLRFFRGISSAVELQVGTQVGILTAPEQRLRVTRKTFAGDKHSSCLSTSVLRAQSLQKNLMPLCSARGVLTFRNQLTVLKAPLTRTSSDSPDQLRESLSGTTVSIPGIVSRSCSQRGFSSTCASSATGSSPLLLSFPFLPRRSRRLLRWLPSNAEILRYTPCRCHYGWTLRCIPTPFARLLFFRPSPAPKSPVAFPITLPGPPFIRRAALSTFHRGLHASEDPDAVGCVWSNLVGTVHTKLASTPGSMQCASVRSSATLFKVLIINQCLTM